MTLAEKNATELITTSRGLALECEATDDVITSSLRRSGTWEESVAEAIDRYLEPGMTFLDLGAHVGLFALQAANKGNPVIAVEADPGYAALLMGNASRNGLDIEVHNVAVADWAGGGALHRDARFIDNPAASYLTDVPSERPVLVRHLSELLDGRRPQFIKADIEGLEYRVFKDSPEILDAAEVIIVEVGNEMCQRYGSTIADMIDLLRGHGLGVTYVTGEPLDQRVREMKRDYYTNLLARRGYEEPAPFSAWPTIATILLCAWRNLVIETVECLMRLRDRGWGYVIKRGDALISRSRSMIVSQWYRDTDEDVFLMIDDDIVFEEIGAARVVELARQTRSVACAAYPVKDGGHLACRRMPGQDILFGEGSPAVEVMYPATGFMAVHRDVIDAMVAARDATGEPIFPLCGAAGQLPMWPFFDCFAKKQDDGTYEYLSEDYAFGEQARRLGFKVWLDPSVILYHMGTYPYTIENMKNVKNFEVPE